MSAVQPWTPAGPDIQAVLARYPDPLGALAEARIPAIVLRQAYAPAHCAGLIRRFIDRGLMLSPEEHSRTADARSRAYHPLPHRAGAPPTLTVRERRMVTVPWASTRAVVSV